MWCEQASRASWSYATGSGIINAGENRFKYRPLPQTSFGGRAPAQPELVALASKEGQVPVTDAARAVLAHLAAGDRSRAAGRERCRPRAFRTRSRGRAPGETSSATYSLRSVINATGVILHTNLGRAPLAASALDHIRDTAESYSNLEFDIETGERGKRDVHVDRLFRKLLDEHVGTADSPAVQPTRSSAAAASLHHRRQQQRRSGPAGAEYAGRRRRSHRLPRRAGRDRRIVPHSGRHVEVERHPARSGHHQSHPYRRLRTRDQRKDPAAAARASLQFSDHRIHRAAADRGTGRAWLASATFH